MAISLMQSDSNVAHGVNVYVMDERADKEKLYMLNNSREWKEL